MEPITQLAFVMVTLGSSMTTSVLTLRKCHFLLHARRITSFFMCAADSVRCASSLLSPSRPVGLTSANVFSPVSTPVRPAAVTPDSAPRVRLLNQRPLDSSSLTSFKRVVFQDLLEPRPLKNIGNSCFVSSSIQCVVACCRAAPAIVGFRAPLLDFVSAYVSGGEACVCS